MFIFKFHGMICWQWNWVWP